MLFFKYKIPSRLSTKRKNASFFFQQKIVEIFFTILQLNQFNYLIFVAAKENETYAIFSNYKKQIYDCHPNIFRLFVDI